jgi:hypothetical protein
MATGWTFEQYYAQDRSKVTAMLLYGRLKTAFQNERARLDSKKKGKK